MNDRSPDHQDGQHWAQSAREEVLEFTAKIAETVREPFLVLDPDHRVVFANPSFYACFKVDEAATEGRLIYELGNNGWDIPELRRLLHDVLPNDERFVDYRVEHRFETIGERVMILNGRRLDHAQLILLAIEDVTARDRAERRLRDSEARLAGVLAHLPVGVGLFDTQGRFTLKNPGLETVMGGHLPSQSEIEAKSWRIVDPNGEAVAPQDYPGFARSGARLRFHRWSFSTPRMVMSGSCGSAPRQSARVVQWRGRHRCGGRHRGTAYTRPCVLWASVPERFWKAFPTRFTPSIETGGSPM